MTWLDRLCAVGKWVLLAVLVAVLARAAFDLAAPLLGSWSGP